MRMFVSKNRLTQRVLMIAITAIVFFMALAVQAAGAQILSYLHSFANRPDGNSLFDGPTMHSAGNIYAVTMYGGSGGGGTAGNLYGTTVGEGQYGYGSVWEIQF